MSDFDQQYAFGIQIFGGVQQDLAGGVQTVFSAAQGEFGFVQVFVGQHIDRFGIDIRRVGNNQVVCTFQSFEQIGMNQVDTVFQAIVFDVDGGYFQRIQTQIDGVNFGGRVVVCHLDGEAAAAGA